MKNVKIISTHAEEGHIVVTATIGNAQVDAWLQLPDCPDSMHILVSNDEKIENDEALAYIVEAVSAQYSCNEEIYGHLFLNSTDVSFLDDGHLYAIVDREKTENCIYLKRDSAASDYANTLLLDELYYYEKEDDEMNATFELLHKEIKSNIDIDKDLS